MSIYRGKIREKWYDLLEHVFESGDFMSGIFSKIRQASKKHIRPLYPTKIQDIFKIFNVIDPDDVKVVILCGEPNVIKHHRGLAYEYNLDFGPTEAADEILYELSRCEVQFSHQRERKYSKMTKALSDYHTAKSKLETYEELEKNGVPFVTDENDADLNRDFLESEIKKKIQKASRATKDTGLHFWNILDDPKKADYHPVHTWIYQGVLCINTSLTWFEGLDYVNPNETESWDIWKPFILELLIRLRSYRPNIVFSTFDPFVYSDKDYNKFLTKCSYHVLSTYVQESNFFLEVNRQLEANHGCPEATIDWNLTNFS